MFLSSNADRMFGIARALRAPTQRGALLVGKSCDSETDAVARRRQVEVTRDRRGEIGKTFSSPDRSRRAPWTDDEKRDLLARVIGSAPGRITAMIGGDRQK